MYRLGSSPCSGVGLQWSYEEFDAAKKGRIAAILFDDVGKSELKQVLSGVIESSFEQEELKYLMEDLDHIENWQVGEAIAEAYLTDHRSCSFPWPIDRDKKKSGSSLPGADLVGFERSGNSECFVFGEVKTSSEFINPPRVMLNRDGLKGQLELIRDDKNTRVVLFKYLAHRSKSSDWCGQFKRAARRYLQDSSDFRLYGFLVRDVNPHQNDLKKIVNILDSKSHKRTRIELLALYLPLKSLDGIGQSMIAQRKKV